MRPVRVHSTSAILGWLLLAGLLLAACTTPATEVVTTQAITPGAPDSTAAPLATGPAETAEAPQLTEAAPADATAAAPQAAGTSAAYLPLQSNNEAEAAATQSATMAAPQVGQPTAGIPDATLAATAATQADPTAALPQTGQATGAAYLPLQSNNEASPAATSAAPAGAATPVAPGGVPQAAQPAAPDMRPQEGARRLINTQLGYALRFPSDYDMAIYAEDGVALVRDSLLNVDAPRLDLRVQPAEGQTLDTAAERFAAGYPGANLARSEITLGGEPAVMLDQVPGQEMERIVLAIHAGRLYLLRFTPADPARGQVFGTMEQLYQVVIDSFVFDPQP